MWGGRAESHSDFLLPSPQGLLANSGTQHWESRKSGALESRPLAASPRKLGTSSELSFLSTEGSKCFTTEAAALGRRPLLPGAGFPVPGHQFQSTYCVYGAAQEPGRTDVGKMNQRWVLLPVTLLCCLVENQPSPAPSCPHTCRPLGDQKPSLGAPFPYHPPRVAAVRRRHPSVGGILFPALLPQCAWFQSWCERRGEWSCSDLAGRDLLAPSFGSFVL